MLLPVRLISANLCDGAKVLFCHSEYLSHLTLGLNLSWAKWLPSTGANDMRKCQSRHLNGRRGRCACDFRTGLFPFVIYAMSGLDLSNLSSSRQRAPITSAIHSDAMLFTGQLLVSLACAALGGHMEARDAGCLKVAREEPQE